MKYDRMTNDQIERVFAEDVLGWDESGLYWVDDDYGTLRINIHDFHPLTDLNRAMLGAEKLFDRWVLETTEMHTRSFTGVTKDFKSVGKALGKDTPQAAIVEACIKIKRPDLFEGD